MSGSVARRYAKALFGLALEAGTLEETGGELERLAAVAAQPDIGPALANPLLSEATRRALAQTLAEQLSLEPTTRNFVCLLADHQRLDQLQRIADHFRRMVDRQLGRVRANLTLAVELDTDQRAALIGELERMTGKSVLATGQVDPALLGGIVVEIEGKVFDGSVRTQLERLAESIAGGRSYL